MSCLDNDISINEVTSAKCLEQYLACGKRGAGAKENKQNKLME